MATVEIIEARKGFMWNPFFMSGGDVYKFSTRVYLTRAYGAYIWIPRKWVG